MKTITAILFAALLVGCASADPLPAPPKAAPFVVGFTNTAQPPLLAGNRLWLLPPTAPDFAAGRTSTNWQPGNISSPATSLAWTNPPPGALLTVSALDPAGTEAVATSTVTNNNQVITSPNIR